MPHPVAVVTGHSSGIGLAITSHLLEQGWQVYGMSRRTIEPKADRLIQYSVDLCDETAIGRATSKLTELVPELHLLINCAGIGHFAMHEDIPAEKISEIVRLNFLAPLLLTRHLLKSVKACSGTIINVASFSAYESSSFGAAYGASKAGLLHFSRSLFDEVRKFGVKVVTISPDITQTPFYDDASFAPQDVAEAFITPECIVEIIGGILSQRRETVTTEVVVRPQRLLLNKRSKPLPK